MPGRKLLNVTTNHKTNKNELFIAVNLNEIPSCSKILYSFSSNKWFTSKI